MNQNDGLTRPSSLSATRRRLYLHPFGLGVLGFEPRTSALSELRSSQLSYTPASLFPDSSLLTPIRSIRRTKQKSQTGSVWLLAISCCDRKSYGLVMLVARINRIGNSLHRLSWLGDYRRAIARVNRVASFFFSPAVSFTCRDSLYLGEVRPARDFFVRPQSIVQVLRELEVAHYDFSLFLPRWADSFPRFSGVGIVRLEPIPHILPSMRSLPTEENDHQSRRLSPLFQIERSRLVVKSDEAAPASKRNRSAA